MFRGCIFNMLYICGWSAQDEAPDYEDMLDDLHADLHVELVQAMLLNGANVNAVTAQVRFAGTKCICSNNSCNQLFQAENAHPVAQQMQCFTS